MLEPGSQNQPPALAPGNPGVGDKGVVAFANANCQWTEEIDLVPMVAKAMSDAGFAIEREEWFLRHPDSGFAIVPRIVSLQFTDPGTYSTVTTIQVNHPRLWPGGVFEYQHASAGDLSQALAQGIEWWLRGDLPALLDALRDELQDCTSLRIELPATEQRPAQTRRVVLGPVGHVFYRPPDCIEPAPEPEAHPFCPCCMLTNSWAAFRDFVEGVDTFAVRLFAMRDADGNAQADCRVNGEDYPNGAETLTTYVDKWPPGGFEVRRQYAVIHTV